MNPSSRSLKPMVTTLADRLAMITWLTPEYAIVNDGDNQYTIQKRSNCGWSCTCPRPTGRLCTHMLTAERTA